MKFTIAIDDNADTAKAVQQGLEAFNREIIGMEIVVAPLILAVRDENGKLCGGIVARTYTDSLYFDTVWVDQALRGAGHGRAMMMKAEDEGRRRGARHAWLATLSWQARPFYEKLGYRVFGEIPLLDGKHTRYFMQKQL
jgi:ribosomal protein S18 acetylase RimI-like enzyme